MSMAKTQPAIARDCAHCASRLVGLCSPLTPDVLSEVAEQATHLHYAAREAVFLQGDPARHAFTLIEGAVRLSRLLPDGRRAAIGFRLAGDLVGFTPAQEYPFSAEAMGPVTICRIERRRLDALFERHPVMKQSLLDLFTRELAATQDHVMALGRFTAEERVAGFLVSLAEAQRRRGWHGKVLDLMATRGDIADLLGLTLETVSRVFSAFKRRGLIALHGPQSVEFLDSVMLQELAVGEGCAD